MFIMLLHLPRPPGGSRKLYRNPLKGSTFWILPLVLSLKKLLPLEAVWAFKLGLGMWGRDNTGTLFRAHYILQFSKKGG